jgi:hypothetical protein
MLRTTMLRTTMLPPTATPLLTLEQVLALQAQML